MCGTAYILLHMGVLWNAQVSLCKDTFHEPIFVFFIASARVVYCLLFGMLHCGGW